MEQELFTAIKIPNTMNKFYVSYKLSNRQQIITNITVQNFYKKVIYLLKYFPYPDLVRKISFQIKFEVFKEVYIIETVNQTIEEEVEDQIYSDNNSNCDFDDFNYLDYYEGNETD